ncbi:MAG: indole-3-glycerol phosphate synthase TrpC [Clostridiales bacterium]|nr:indole-3-glycerol phosphate synthase TrpC [Clostridiales bacterium]
MSNTILNEIAAYTKERYAAIKKKESEKSVTAKALAMKKGAFEFEKALGAPGLSFICEIKKASPSKGLISPDFPYLKIALEYEKGGADCISCLTEPRWFLGADEYLRKIKAAVSIPVLRKDFTLSSYQIYEAKLLGADCVLLICALLSESQIREYIAICNDLGISALVEAHSEPETETALRAGARIVGVNNRNLNDFSVDVSNSARMRRLIPENIIYVSESGVKSRADIETLQANNTNAVLIGEALMRAPDRAAALKELRGNAN